MRSGCLLLSAALLAACAAPVPTARPTFVLGARALPSVAAPGVVSPAPATAGPAPAASLAPSSAPAGTPSATASTSPAPGAPAVTTLAGSDAAGFADGPGASARFDGPLGLAYRADGSLVVADANNHCVRLVAPDGTTTTLAGDGSAGYLDGPGATAELDEPAGVVVAMGSVLVADPWNHCIRRIAADGKVSTLAGQQEVGSADGSPADARFDSPYAMALDARGRLFVAERFAQTIRMVTLASNGQATGVTTVAGSFETTGSDDGVGAAARFGNPVAIAPDPRVTDHTVLYVAEEDGCKLRRVDVDASGQGTVTTLAVEVGYCGQGAGATTARPLGMVVAPALGLLVGDAANASLRRVAGDPLVATPLLRGLAGPAGLAVGPDGSLAFADGNAIKRVALAP